MAKPGKLSVPSILRMSIMQFMAKPRQTSFRRILLFRILLLSIPVLLLGQYVIYKKARSSLLETARRNLTESAVRKGERIEESIQALEANLLTASETVVLKSGSAQEVAKFFTLLTKQLPTNIECIQLTNVSTGQVVVSTCGNRAIASIQANLWPQQQSQMLADRSIVRVATPLRSRKSPTDASQDTQINSNGEVELVLTAPVYDSTGALRNALTIHSTLYQQQLDKPGSLAGYTVIIDDSGTILEHPVANLVGRNVEQLEDANRLKILIKNALSGEPNFLHLFAFEKRGGESVAGYTAIPSPLSNNQNKKWVILAVASLDNALFGLAEINNVLFNLVLWLLGANLIATLYVARDLARPLEKLGDYALNVRGRGFPSKMPHDFKIKEFNQLVEALDSMVERLTAWAEELETAWKEAQAANQLKSEFLANTSHELRTPLNGIIGCIRLVRDGYCDDREEELEFLQRADDAAIHLLNIINDILDLSKIEAGTLSVVMESVDLRSIVKEAIDLQKVHIQQKKLQLLWSEPVDSIAIQADPAKLKQVFLNVIGNAIKFTEAGSITISMRQEATPSKDGNNNSSSVFVSVKDTGIGIPLDEQKKLFRPFVMADGTRTRKYGGTGLGLAISRKLMELMGGTISLHSAGVDLGTTVEIGIPIINSSRSIAPADAASN
ncbi:ATP-binding protein [Aerosakkonema funiforme]|uniref:ATP-binding protein n=1 Tax=Aerosakkonema funiforme TaxID=1246630 RepID=UPI0035BB55AA